MIACRAARNQGRTLDADSAEDLISGTENGDRVERRIPFWEKIGGQRTAGPYI